MNAHSVRVKGVQHSPAAIFLTTLCGREIE